MNIITSAIIASQSISPFYFNEYIQTINSELIADWVNGVRRVYCSNKSLGFDLHFNSRSGQLYSFNEFSNRLERFNIRSEIPFMDIFAYEYGYSFIRNWEASQMNIDTNVGNGNFLMKLYSLDSPENYIIAKMNLSSLKVKVELYSPDATRKQQDIADRIASQIKCEYIEPESYKL